MPQTTSADDQFYREYILDHYKNPRNYGRLEHADVSHEEDNPLCGDVVGMDFRIQDGVIEDIKFHGRGCAISQASASLLTERIKGLSLWSAVWNALFKKKTPAAGQDKIDAVVNGLAIKRLGTFEDCLNVCDFFISPRSDNITAQVVYLGGVS